jgi:threonine aldolase
MPPLTRRNFAGACVAAGTLGPLEALARTLPSPAAGASAARPPVVDLVGDGIPLSPAEYATLLASLAQGGLAADEYSRGGAVEALEAQFARLLGTEAAVFVPTGTLANHLAVRTLSGARLRVAVQETSHLYNDSGDCAQTLSALHLVPLAPGEATFGWEDVDRLLARTASGRVATAVGAISIESPVRRLRNQAFDFAEMERISRQARARGLGLHLDGARLFVAAAVSGRAPAEYAALFDTVYVSLWKCFNAAGGAVLAGRKALLAEMYHARRMFGGALWHAWPYAAVASHYAEGYLERLRRAFAVADDLIARLAAGAELEAKKIPGGTSVFLLRPRRADAERMRAGLAREGIVLPPPHEGAFWPRVNETLAGASAAELAAAFHRAAEDAGPARDSSPSTPAS